MKYKITRISPLKAAISVTAIRFVGVLIAIIFALMMKSKTDSVVHGGPEVEKGFHLVSDVIGPLLEGTVSIFVSTFIAFFIFNKLCHYWGGIEFDLEKIMPSNHQMSLDK